MLRFVGVLLLGLALQACSMMRPFDQEDAFFAALFDGPSGSGSCRQLRSELKASIEDIKAAQKKADDDFIAEQSAPAEPAPPQRFPRKGFPRNGEMAPLKDLARRTKQAEDLNLKLKVRGCRTVDIEQALKAEAPKAEAPEAPAQGEKPAPTQ
jgi:hypothetical protein